MTDRYRKKPVEVRAWKIGFDGQEPDWVREAFDDERIDWCPAGEGLYINTLEGHMKAGIGDMLIEGVKGELYGCRADIFEATYQSVDEGQPTYSELLAQRDELQRKLALAVTTLEEIGAYRGDGPTYTTPWQDIVRTLGKLARNTLSLASKEPDMDTKDSDRELLKWAAKAAGYEVVSDALASSYGGGKPTLYLLHNGPSWNPLTDDGDALRLAVKLAAKISHTTDSVLVSIDGIVRSVRSYYGDPYAATRRAIVRAAAEIGRNMP